MTASDPAPAGTATARAGPDAAPVRDAAGTPGSGLPGGSLRLPGWLAVTVAMLAELLIGGYRIAGPSFWRDEAATISGADRSFGAIFALIQHEDAVHAPYYLLLHPVIAAFGTSETALRLPSLLAACLAAGMTAALGRRLAIASAWPAPAATGLLAGLALASVPLSTRYAQEARPYALATLTAVLASYLLLRAVAGSHWGWWAGYGVALTLTGWFNLFALPLLALAHGVSLGLTARRPRAEQAGGDAPAGAPSDDVTAATIWRWLAACAGAAILVSPIAVLSAGQAAQIGWVTRPGPSAVASLIRDFAGTTPLILVVAGLAVVAITGRRGTAGPGRLSLPVLALPWLVLPPVLLIGVSLADPVYVERYVMFCLPALSLLVGAGLTVLPDLIRGRGWLDRLWPKRRWRLTAVPSVLLGLIMAVALAGPQAAIRQEAARADDLRAVAAVLAARERPGDAIIYLPWGTAMVGMAYPVPFEALNDIELARSPVASASLRGTQVSPGTLSARLSEVHRVWVIRWAQPPSGSGYDRTDRAAAAAVSGMRPIGSWTVGSVVLSLYQVS